MHYRTIGFHLLRMLLCVLLFGGTAAQARDGSFPIANYPVHGTELSPVQLDALRWYAGKLADEIAAERRVEVLVIGHADLDQRGRDFETDISRQRADNGVAKLREFVDEEARRRQLPPARLGLIAYRTEALGTRELIYEKPASELQRRANRRIEIAWMSTTPPPKPPGPAQSTEFEIRVVGGFSASLLLQADNYIFQIVDLKAKKTAFFFYTAGGLGISLPKIPGPGSMTYAGPPTRFTTTRSVELHQFNSKASLFQDPGATAGPLSAAGTFRLSIEEIIDAQGLLASTRPGIIPVEGGTGLQMPGLGSVTTGVLALHSAIFPFNGY
ncbi:hypothetical protein [Pseudoduganella umbonata]|uniref:OmpA family protein n=1 Tax=Pseudoduganella umbonata TaxID=864828 RepID=A0A4P8HMU2_9BURK|nr:hypothetical protein [Pseudoduganella umbonata]MBB3219616.1 hypothetical protein [Pseudoduganella umbonata]QCP09680.1 hypothetical protein FCL38_04025 [Pseudoduganella umbonata]